MISVLTSSSSGAKLIMLPKEILEIYNPVFPKSVYSINKLEKFILINALIVKIEILENSEFLK